MDELNVLFAQMTVGQPRCDCCETNVADPRYDGEVEADGKPVRFCKECARELIEVRFDLLRPRRAA
jgi:hypothetical protein